MSLGTLSRPYTALTERAAGGLLELVADVAPDGRTYLSRRSQRFPLRLTTPLYLDPARPGMAFLYVQNPTGGLFEDDDHTIALSVQPGARVHLTTQAASKVYRAEGGCARQRVTLTVAEGAFAEYVPDLLIPHAGARLKQEVVADVEPGGRLIVSEAVAPGRVACGEAFEYSSLSLTTRIWCGGEQRAVDSVLLEPNELDPRRAGVLGDQAYLASVFVVAPGADSEALAGTISQAADGVPGCLVGTSTLPSAAGVLTRILARSGISAGRALEAAWSAARVALIGAS
ncbi:MAG: urease accessory protein UreD, partial [Thermoleophilaceae bacterium]|nr:urease accessory protein UreD [Thermoleophilaceae bacterium]